MEKKLILFALMSIMITTPFFAQNRIISGTVKVSEDNMPLPGVNVIIKGTNNGTVTDMQGKYSLEVTPNAILVFSAIGFVSQEIEISGQEELNVSLVQDTESLDEVVVTALGISRDKKSLGYATQEVEGEDLNITNQQNVLGTLSGRVAGVQVTGSSGASMGGTQKIKIRGVNSINGGDEPLIVIDGTPISNSNFSGSSGAD